MVSKLWKIWSGLFIPDPGSGCWLSTHPGSRIQGSKMHRIPDPDPQHCLNYGSRYNSAPDEQYCGSAASGAGLRSSRIWTPLDFKLFSSVSDPPSLMRMYCISNSVGDPDPDPQDLYVFGPPGFGSGSISQRYGSGSGSRSFPFLK